MFTVTYGGWIVIQRNRIKSKLSFDKNWREYEKGFSDLNGDSWAGLEMLHILTQGGQWEISVDYQKNDKTWSYLHYNQFSVGSANEEYPLTVGGYSGSILSSQVLYYNGMKFTTPDNDNDKWNGGNCAPDYKSGNWYNSCRHIDLNHQPSRVDTPGDVLFSVINIRPWPIIASHNNSLL